LFDCAGWLYRLNWLIERFKVPVLVVGKCRVEAGKTPLVIALGKKHFQSQYAPVAVLRGYGRQAISMKFTSQHPFQHQVMSQPH
jgi:tetraacyldisaccharide-1-P 4'-kinase